MVFLRQCLHLMRLSALLWALVASSSASAATADENSVKAAFLYNFLGFTEWPETVFPSKETPFTLCTFAADGGLVQALATLTTKTLYGRPIAVRPVASETDIAACNLLYIDSAGAATGPLLSMPAGVLTVSDAADFTERGGMIGLIRNDNRFAFNINAQSASRAGLQFSAKLLRLASNVRR